jgi:hypothetical protein
MSSPDSLDRFLILYSITRAQVDVALPLLRSLWDQDSLIAAEAGKGLDPISDDEAREWAESGQLAVALVAADGRELEEADLTVENRSSLKAVWTYRQILTPDKDVVLSLFAKLNSNLLEYLSATPPAVPFDADAMQSVALPSEVFVGHYDAKRGALVEDKSLRGKFHLRLGVDAVMYGGSIITAHEYRGSGIASALSLQKGLSLLEQGVEFFKSNRRVFVVYVVDDDEAGYRNALRYNRSILKIFIAIGKQCDLAPVQPPWIMHWPSSRDGRTYVFMIDPDVHFADQSVQSTEARCEPEEHPRARL